VLFKFVFALSAPQHEHSLELFQGDSVQELPGLREGKPEFLQRDDPVQLSQLLGRVAAIAGSRIDLRRAQQPDPPGRSRTLHSHGPPARAA
jgi:hypothetical protein